MIWLLKRIISKEDIHYVKNELQSEGLQRCFQCFFS